MKEHIFFKLPNGETIEAGTELSPILPCRGESVTWDEVLYTVGAIEHIYKKTVYDSVIINLHHITFP